MKKINLHQFMKEFVSAAEKKRPELAQWQDPKPYNYQTLRDAFFSEFGQGTSPSLAKIEAWLTTHASTIMDFDGCYLFFKALMKDREKQLTGILLCDEDLFYDPHEEGIKQRLLRNKIGTLIENLSGVFQDKNNPYQARKKLLCACYSILEEIDVDSDFNGKALYNFLLQCISKMNKECLSLETLEKLKTLIHKVLLLHKLILGNYGADLDYPFAQGQSYTVNQLREDLKGYQKVSIPEKLLEQPGGYFIQSEAAHVLANSFLQEFQIICGDSARLPPTKQFEQQAVISDCKSAIQRYVNSSAVIKHHEQRASALFDFVNHAIRYLHENFPERGDEDATAVGIDMTVTLRLLATVIAHEMRFFEQGQGQQPQAPIVLRDGALNAFYSEQADHLCEEKLDRLNQEPNKKTQGDYYKALNECKEFLTRAGVKFYMLDKIDEPKKHQREGLPSLSDPALYLINFLTEFNSQLTKVKDELLANEEGTRRAELESLSKFCCDLVNEVGSSASSLQVGKAAIKLRSKLRKISRSATANQEDKTLVNTHLTKLENIWRLYFKSSYDLVCELDKLSLMLGHLLANIDQYNLEKIDMSQLGSEAERDQNYNTLEQCSSNDDFMLKFQQLNFEMQLAILKEFVVYLAAAPVPMPLGCRTTPEWATRLMDLVVQIVLKNSGDERAYSLEDFRKLFNFSFRSPNKVLDSESEQAWREQAHPFWTENPELYAMFKEHAYVMPSFSEKYAQQLRDSQPKEETPKPKVFLKRAPPVAEPGRQSKEELRPLGGESEAGEIRGKSSRKQFDARLSFWQNQEQAGSGNQRHVDNVEPSSRPNL